MIGQQRYNTIADIPERKMKVLFYRVASIPIKLSRGRGKQVNLEKLVTKRITGCCPVQML
jgi:hypothetical protein